jgi:hypothetical protein
LSNSFSTAAGDSNVDTGGEFVAEPAGKFLADGEGDDCARISSLISI